MPYVAWRELIEGSVPAEGVDIGFSALVVPEERQAQLLGQCHELLFQDEFEYWFLDVDELGDLDEQYLNMVESKGPDDRRTHPAPISTPGCGPAHNRRVPWPGPLQAAAHGSSAA